MSLVQIMMQLPPSPQRPPSPQHTGAPGSFGAKSAQSPGKFMPSAPQMAPPQDYGHTQPWQEQPPSTFVRPPEWGAPQTPQVMDPSQAVNSHLPPPQGGISAPQPQGQPMPMQPPQGMPQRPAAMLVGGKSRPAPGGFRPQGRPSFGPRV